MKTVRVETPKKAPILSNPAIVYGITSKAAAEAWGWKNGYALVYWLKSKQKCYAEKGKRDD